MNLQKNTTMIISLIIVAILGAFTIGTTYNNSSGASYLGFNPCNNSLFTQSAPPQPSSTMPCPTAPAPTPVITSSTIPVYSSTPNSSCVYDSQLPSQVSSHTDQAVQAADSATKKLPDDVTKLGNDLVAHVKSADFGNGLLTYLAGHHNGKLIDNVNSYLQTDLNPYSTQFTGFLTKYTKEAANQAYGPLLQDLNKISHGYGQGGQMKFANRYGSFNGNAAYVLSPVTGSNIDIEANISANIYNDIIQLHAGYRCGVTGDVISHVHVYSASYALISVNMTNTPYGTFSLSYDLARGKGNAEVNLQKTWHF